MLTDKQLAFVNAYLTNGFNATQAAIAAGYSTDTARQMGSENLSKPDIQKYIQDHQKAMEKKTQVTTEKLINELSKVAFANVQDYFEPGNQVKDVTELKKKKAAAVLSVKTKKRKFTTKDGELIESEEVELKLHDKLSAIRSIGDHLGSWKKSEAEPEPDKDLQININIIDRNAGTRD